MTHRYASNNCIRVVPMMHICAKDEGMHFTAFFGICFTTTVLQYYICLGIVLTVILVLQWNLSNMVTVYGREVASMCGQEFVVNCFLHRV